MKNKKNKRNNGYVNKFTGESLCTYPVMADLLGVKVSNKTTNTEKLKGQVDRFNSKYKCPYCGEEREWIPSTNIMICKNKTCKGHEVANKKGEKKCFPSFQLLSNRGESIAETLFE